MRVGTFFKWFVVALTITSIVAVLGAVGYQFNRARLSERVLEKIDRLVLRPPTGTGQMEWTVRVFWTHNLHCNAMPNVYGSIASLNKLDHHLDHAMANGTDSQTLDMLWDIYETMSPSGARYRAEYEMVRDEYAKAIAREGEEFYDFESYEDFLQYVKSKNRLAD